MNTLSQLVSMTREVGQPDGGYVILGEGNTSARDGETLWVKASGHAMANIDETGFAQVNIQQVIDLLGTTDLSDEELRTKLNESRTKPKRDGYPSTETFMHAWLLGLPNVNFIAHTHPTSTLGIMCSPVAEEFSNNRYFPDQIVLCGPRSVFIPYVAPGLILAQEIRDKCTEYTNETGLTPKTILLQNHGMIALGENAKEALSATQMMEKTAQVFVAAQNPNPLAKAEIDHIHNWTDEHFRQGKIWSD